MRDRRQSELERFLTDSVTDRTPGSSKRLFMVYRDRIDRFCLPAPLRDLIGYKFWTEDERGNAMSLGFPAPTKEQATYWSALNQIGVEMAETLKGIEPGGQRDSSVIVHLAEVTEDLEPTRQQVELYLRQSKISVLPKGYYPRDSVKRFQDAVEADLRTSKLFVQLLSSVPGRKPTELPQGYTGLQYQLAQVARKEILQWRSPTLDVHAVTDQEHRRLLSSATVFAEGIEAFKARVS